MEKQCPIRYGRNYKVILAIVLPGLLTIPFILILQAQPNLKEWELWLLIVAFLLALILCTLWLVFSLYPKAVLRLNHTQINISFEDRNFLHPSDFSFQAKDIVRFTHHQIGSDKYVVFQTRHPRRKFQLSASSYHPEEFLSFNEVIAEISEIFPNFKVES